MATAREEIAALARDLLVGRVDLQAGCRALVRLSKTLAHSEQHDGAIVLLVGVDSELDDCPVGSAREEWEPLALAERDQRRDAYLGGVRGDVLAACRALLEWR